MKIIHAQDIKSHFNIAILVNRDSDAEYSDRLLHALVERLEELEFSEDNITIVYLDSVMDIPLFAKALADTNEYSGIIAGGFYLEEEYSEYLPVVKSCIDLSVATKTPILLQGIEYVATDFDDINHIARGLAERAYTAISIMGQLD